MTIQLLKRIESLIRLRNADDSGVIADYFDLIGGISTGVILAPALALGWKFSRIEKTLPRVGRFNL